MRLGRTLSFILIETSISFAFAGELPGWIVSGPTSDERNMYFVCSDEGIEPQALQEIVEAKCIASAARAGGVTITSKTKTVQSLAGNDSNDVVEVTPIRKSVKCEFTDRFLEVLGTHSFRLWLRCRTGRVTAKEVSEFGAAVTSKADATSIAKQKTFKRGLLTVTSVPEAEKIIVLGQGTERAVDVTSNVQVIELHEGDEAVLVRKLGYRDSRQELGEWKNASAMTLNFKLEREH